MNREDAEADCARLRLHPLASGTSAKVIFDPLGLAHSAAYTATLQLESRSPSPLKIIPHPEGFFVLLGADPATDQGAALEVLRGPIR